METPRPFTFVRALVLPLSIVVAAACGGSTGGDGSSSTGDGSTGGGSSEAGAGGSSAAGTSSTGGSTANAGTTASGGSLAAGGTTANAGTSASGGSGGDAAGGMMSGMGGMCDVGTPPPNLPTFMAQLVYADASHPIPTETGGDPTGTWIFQSATLYMPQQAMGIVDVMKSMASGNGWARLDSMMNFALDASIMGQIVTTFGNQKINNNTSVTGTYTTDGAMIMDMATCGGSQNVMPMIQFTRKDQNDMEFLVTVTVMSFPINIVFEATAM